MWPSKVAATLEHSNHSQDDMMFALQAISFMATCKDMSARTIEVAQARRASSLKGAPAKVHYRSASRASAEAMYLLRP